MTSSPELSLPGELHYRRGSASAASARHLFGRRRSPDVESLIEHLLDIYPDAPHRCAEEGVQRILPALDLRFSPLDPAASDDEVRGAMWNLLCRAVSRSIRGAHRVAVALGGIDSSGVLAALCECRPASDVVAYTYDYADGADVPFAEQLCQAYGVELRRLKVADALPFLRQTLVIDGLPSIGFGACVELHLQSVLADAGFDRYLTGGFGDDLLGGEASTFWGAFRRAPARGLSTLINMQTPWQVPLIARVNQYLLKPFANRIIPLSMQMRRARRGLGARAPWLSRSTERTVERLARSVGPRYRPARSPDELRQRRIPMYQHGLGARAQVVVAGGVSRGDPLLWPEFSDFATGLSILRLYSEGMHRGTFRRCLPPRVPEAVRNRPSKAMMGDQLDRLAEGSREVLRPLASVDRLAALGVVDADAFEVAFNRHPPCNSTIWAALSAEAFLREG